MSRDFIDILIDTANDLLPPPDFTGKLCHDCHAPATSKCPCGQYLCGRHSYNTEGNACSNGLCSECVDLCNPT